MVLENQNVAEAFIVLQVQHAVPVSPQHVFHSAFWERRQRGGVIRRFNDHFVRADSVHLVEQAFSFAVQLAFDPQRRKAIRHHAQLPSRRVRSSPISPVYQHFRRRLGLIAEAEGTILRLSRDDAFAQKVVWPLSALR